MLRVLVHCPLCEERDPRDALFVHPDRVEAPPILSVDRRMTCLRGHEDARILVGVFEFDDRRGLVELVDGLGLKYTRDVFERLTPLIRENLATAANRVSKPAEAAKPMTGWLRPVTLAILLALGAQFEATVEANDAVEGNSGT
jgi:hypothetical protein